MKEIKFNLNDNIKVKLKSEGFLHWMHDHNEVYDKMEATFGKNDISDEQRKPASFFMDKRDVDGYVTFHAWQFMRIFGNSIVFGKLPIFNPNVIIEIHESDLGINKSPYKPQI